MTSSPTTMRAVRLSAPGPVDNLRLTTLPLPPERDDWVRIRVEAFGLNRSERKLRLGLGVSVSLPPGAGHRDRRRGLIQSAVSLAIGALVIARAVNIL
jgi:hypothetical protein